MTTSNKLWLGFGTLTALLMLSGVAILVRVRSLEVAVHEKVNDPQLGRGAARELAINLVDYALAVHEYLYDGDPQARRQAAAEAADVERELADYARRAATDRQRHLGSHFADRWRELSGLGRAILDAADRRPAADVVAQFNDLRRGLEQFLDDEMHADALDSLAASRDAALRDVQTIAGFVRVLLFVGVVLAVLTSVAVGRGVVRGERVIAEQGERLRNIFNQTTAGIAQVDLAGRFQMVNRRFCEITGYAEEELRQKTCADITHPDDQACNQAMFETALKERQPYVIEKRYVRPDGSHVWVRNSVSAITDGDGRMSHVLAVSIDVTDRKLAEEAVRESERRYRLVSQAANDAIWDWDLITDQVAWNEGVRTLFGYAAAAVEPAATWWYDRIHPDDRDRVKAGIRAAIDGGKELWQDEYRFRRADGSYAEVIVRGRVVRQGGRPVRMAGSMMDLTERKRAEEERARLLAAEQAARQRYQDLVDGLDAIVWEADATTWEFTFVSRRAEQILGYPVERWRSDPMFWVNLIHPDDRAYAVNLCQLATARCHDHDFEYRAVAADGRVVWLRDIVYVVPGPDGRARHLRGVMVDVTAMKRAEEALRESEERLRLALEAGRMGVWDWDVRTNEVKWSDNLEPIHGLPRGSFGGTLEAFERLVHPADRPLVRAAIARALAEQSDYDIEFRNLWPDGSVHWMAGKAKVFAAHGRPVRMIGVGQDITDRKRAEQDMRFLADASATLAALVDYQSTLQKVARLAVPTFADWCAVDMVEPDGTLRRLAVAHVDPSKVELAHELYRRYPPNPDADRGAWHIARTGQSEMIPEITDELLAATVPDPELLAIMRELGLRSYLGVPLTVRGTVLGVLTFIAAESGRRYDARDRAVAEDLAHRAAVAIESARLYQEVQEAGRRKDEFLATLAHELRNPLAPIRNMLEVLKRADGDLGLYRQARDTMERQLGHMVRLIDDLMDAGRITRGKLELRRERVALAAVLEQALETSRPHVAAAGHELLVELPREPVWLDADPVRLAQVFANLLNNAAKYTDRPGRIGLTAVRDGGDVVVRVKDTGIGIPREHLPRLFEMFAQVSSALERSQGGLGIGLALVKGLVELHGGTVRAFSDGPGTGSEFVVRLPALAGHPPLPAPPPANHTGARNGPGHRILVVDDNRDSATSLATLLRLGGNEVATAYDGLEAVAAAERFRPDVVLLDLGMPKLNGYDACRRIQEQPWGRDMVLIALTGWGQEEDKRRTEEAGFDAHLVKPVDPADLMELLAGLLPHVDIR